jgi:hypothetical protein
MLTQGMMVTSVTKEGRDTEIAQNILDCRNLLT